MSERKVLSKYYPPEFNPADIGRRKKRPADAAARSVQTVRLMAPFPMRCTTCGEYIYKGRKFNARKETPRDENYLGLQLFRFYIRCTRCSAEIVFRTDPKNRDYVCERGAKRNNEPWRKISEVEETDEERLNRLEREQDEDEDMERDAMQDLDEKTRSAQVEMAVADMLDEVRMRNDARNKAAAQGMAVLGPAEPSAEELLRQEQDRQDAEEARRAFEQAKKLTEEVVVEKEAEPAVPGQSSQAEPAPAVAVAATPVPTFRKTVKKKTDFSAKLGIKLKKP